MLFLSVVLMLPSSAISMSTKNSNVLLLAVVGFSSVNTVVVLGAVVISIVLAYLVYAFYRTRAYNHTYEIYGEPKQPAKLEYTEVPVSEQIKTLESLYILKNFSSDNLNKKAADSCLSYNIYGEKLSSTDYTTGDNFARVYGDRDLTKYIRGVKGSSYPAYVRVYPKYFFKSRRSLQDYKVVNLLLTVFYEFTDFYFRVLEPGVLNESKIYSAATRGLKKFVNLGVTNPPLPSLWYDENGWRTQCRFNTESKGLVIFVLNRP